MTASDTATAGVPLMVACCQVSLQVGDLAGNRARTGSALEEAAGTGARLVVLPELAGTGYVFEDQAEARSLAESVPGPTTRAWQQLADRLHISVVGGVCELGDDNQLYNSVVVLDGGGLLARYRKVHLWDREKLIFRAGDEPPPVVEVAGSRIGVMICYDVEFPEWVRIPALQRAQLLCVPANWPRFPRPDDERPSEVVRVQAAASVNRMFVAACDRVGHERGVDWVGGSVIVDPEGWPLAGPLPGDQEQILLAECDLGQARVKSISEHNDVIEDRRPRLYGKLTEEGN